MSREHQGTKIERIEGKNWCSDCQTYLDIEMFRPGRRNKPYYCEQHELLRREVYKRNKNAKELPKVKSFYPGVTQKQIDERYKAVGVPDPSCLTKNIQRTFYDNDAKNGDVIHLMVSGVNIESGHVESGIFVREVK